MIGKLKKLYRTNIRPHCEGVYESYNHARQSISSDYEDLDLVNRVVNNTYKCTGTLESGRILDFTDSRFLIAALLGGYRNPKETAITDLGGAAGWGYFLSKMILGKDDLLIWNVVETRELSNCANQVFCEPQLSFTSFECYINSLNIKESVKEQEVLLSSSTLQYLESPEEILEKIVGCQKYQKIWITRTPFLENESRIVSVQKSKLSNNGLNVTGENIKDKVVLYPITFISLPKTIRTFQDHGYKISVFQENAYITAKNICANYYSILAIKDNIY